MHVFFFKMEIKVILEINSENLKQYKIPLMFFLSNQSVKQKYLLKSQGKGTFSIAPGTLFFCKTTNSVQ